MPQFPLCSEFIPLLDTVKNQLAELKNLSQEFLLLGDDEAKQKVLLKSQELREAKQKLAELAEQPVEFEGKTVVRIEKELLVFVRNKVGEDLMYEIDKNRVIDFDVSQSTKSKETLEQVLGFIRCFTRLQDLNCLNTQITTLPELPQNLRRLFCQNTQITTLPELPQNLRVLYCLGSKLTVLPKLPPNLGQFYCEGTPVAKNPETKKQLEAFKQEHPQFNYSII